MSESLGDQRYSTRIEMDAGPAFHYALEERRRVESAGRVGRNQVRQRRCRCEPRVAGGTGILDFLPERPCKSGLVRTPVDDSSQKRLTLTRHCGGVEKRDRPRA